MPRTTCAVVTSCAAALVAAVGSAGIARAQCDGILGGNVEVTGSVYALAELGGELVAAGSFTSIGGVAATNIAAWDGVSWHDLGGTGPNGTVYALAAQGGALVAGGVFSSVGGTGTSNVALWDGESWRPMGIGFIGGVYSLLARGEQMLGAGYVEVKAWDGTTWQGVDELDGTAYAMCNYGGTVVLGGWWFSHLGQVSGTGVSLFAGGDTDGPVYALAVYGGELVAAGSFQHAGPQFLTARNIARWDGLSWHALGTGVNGTVNALAEYSGQLFAGGSFTSAGGVQASGIARWDGSMWRALANGTGAVRALAEYAGSLELDETNVLTRWTECYANCDCSTGTPRLNVADFVCFLQRFASGNPYSNCDGSTQPPVLNVADFTCFLQKFAVGCP